MRVRVEIVAALVALLAAMGAFTLGCYYAAAFLDGLFTGGAGVANVVTLILLAVFTIAALLTIAERKWSAFIQDRMGPNRARLPLPFLKDRILGGVPHLVADGIKMMTKEDSVPAKAEKFLFNLAPILSLGPALCVFAVVPVAPEVEVLGRRVSLQVAQLDVGLLFVFAVASLAVYGTALAGWSSNNKLALLGGVRASAQMIAYEVALGLSLVGIMLAFSKFGTPEVPASQFNSLRLEHLTSGQATYLWWTWVGDFDVGLPAWGIFLQPAGFVLFFAAAFAETKRAPFDMPEGESEIVGYFLEYSGMRFGMFMIGEFVEIVTLAGVTVAAFLGGYHLPFGEAWLTTKLPPLWFGVVLGATFWVKVFVLCWLQLAIRWSFPRFRYDQVQRLGWKMLLPLGLANVLVTGALVLYDPTLKVLAVVGLAEIAALAVLTAAAGQPAPESLHGHGEAAHARGR